MTHCPGEPFCVILLGFIGVGKMSHASSRSPLLFLLWCTQPNTGSWVMGFVVPVFLDILVKCNRLVPFNWERLLPKVALTWSSRDFHLNYAFISKFLICSQAYCAPLALLDVPWDMFFELYLNLVLKDKIKRDYSNSACILFFYGIKVISQQLNLEYLEKTQACRHSTTKIILRLCWLKAPSDFKSIQWYQ